RKVSSSAGRQARKKSGDKSPYWCGACEVVAPNALTPCFGIILLVLNESKPSGEIRLNKFWARMDADLTQNRLPGVDESMRRIRGNHHDAAGFHFARFITDRHAGAAFERELDLDIRMRV